MASGNNKLCLGQQARSKPELLALVEGALNEFVASAARRKMLPVMRSEDRHFAHELSEVYGVQTESVDPEPHRSVQLLKSEWRPGSRPNPLLSEAIAAHSPK
jgi:hypothetical protein